jgi:hypothetical protein
VQRRLALSLVAAVAALAAAQTADAQSWAHRKAAAVRFVETRAGVESFAFVDDRGKLHGYRAWRVVPSASMLKAMLLVAYLNRQSVRRRALTDSDRSLLAPMIRWSDNGTATRVLSIVGPAAMYRLADRANMLHFCLRSPWGLSEMTARDQARFFYRIRSFVPVRHRTYALNLLSSIVPSQRWGIPPVKPPRWSIHFKGGWGSGTGAVTHQGALLRRDRWRIALAVFTTSNPSHLYGTATIRGVASRFLRPRPLPLAVS